MYLNYVIYGIYGRLPIILQNLAISCYGLLLYFQRYGRYYRRFLRIYTNRNYTSGKLAKRYQDKAFTRLVRYAVLHSPYYQERYQNLDWKKITSVKDIRMLPVLTKEELKYHLNEIYTISKYRGIKFYTGGTTGKPMMVLKRKIDVQKRMAYLDAYRLSYGFAANKMRLARFIGKNIIPGNAKKHIFWRDNVVLKQRLYSSYHLKEENLPSIIKNLEQYRPAAIEGFVSCIYTLAKYMEENHLQMKFRPKVIFTTAETVLPLHREVIERVFGCPLSDQYASNEGAPFIIQCRYGQYHEALDTGIFEHIPTSGGMKLVVTSFDSFGTPLIRYDIGDQIIEQEQLNCPCGSCFPTIGGIKGRDTDVLITKSRGKVSLASLSVMVSELSKKAGNVQFIQENPDEILLKIEASEDDFSRLERDKILGHLKWYLGEDMNFHIQFVTQIEREKSGKYRMVLNRMDAEIGKGYGK